MKVNVIIACGGSGQRSGLSFNKILAPINGKAIIHHTISKFYNIGEVTKIIIPATSEDICLIKAATVGIDSDNKIAYCNNGASRTLSIKSALTLVDADADIITIHDGARPFVATESILDSIQTALNCGSGISAYSTVDTIAIANKYNQIELVPDRTTLFNIQTPQSFGANKIITAYSMIGEDDNFTDDSSVYAKHIGAPTLSHGSPENKKITFASDLQIASDCYVGAGYDTHQLVTGRKLVLGGIDIPHPLGLLGHSDADVLTHAIMDALFSSCCERDIGVHFPDTDMQYKGIKSTILLEKCLQIIRAKGYEVKNISCVIMCEKPKLAKIIPIIIDNLATVMDISKDALMISATTTEGLGFVGREEGIAVSASCICCKIKETLC